jgi:hypothetical protein
MLKLTELMALKAFILAVLKAFSPAKEALSLVVVVEKFIYLLYQY